MKKSKLKLTVKVLKSTLTFSAVVLTLSGPVLPLAAQAVDSNQEIITEINQEVDSFEANQLEEKAGVSETSNQVSENYKEIEKSLSGTSVAVSTTADFNTAITSKDIDNIFLTRDIAMNSSLKAPNLGEDRTKQIIGSKFELNMKSYKLAGEKDGSYKL